MAISSLSKLTVPLATSDSASSQGLLMPKLQYRFRVTLENFGVSTPTTELTKQVMDITRPTVSFENMEIPIYNSKVYLAGKHTWAPLTLNLREDVNNNVQKLVGEQLQKQFDFMEQASANSGQDYKFVTRIEILDGGNGATGVNVLETWECYGCFITEANYNSLAYANNEPVNITLNMQYDNAIQTPENTGVGTAVGRTLGTNVTGGG
ncbi:hypothetical protein N9993_00995 [bacterium]|jgi:hypothetical protein|nr:hypothetical protein [bacterium]